jgi:hypothetical protein
VECAAAAAAAAARGACGVYWSLMLLIWLQVLQLQTLSKSSCFSSTTRPMFKTFPHSSLSDLGHEISAATSAASARALDPSTA